MRRLRVHQPRTSRLRQGRALVAGAALALALAGCGGAGRERHAERGLIAGRQGPTLDPAALADGADLARRFAHAYARVAYIRTPPPLPGESAAVARALSAAAGRVPLSRRRSRPQLAGLRVWPLGGSDLRASASIADRRNPPFSVGFTLNRRGGRWLITTVSLPD